MINLVKAEIYKLKRQKLLLILFFAVVLIAAFSAFSEINLLSAADGPVSGKMSFANAFQDIFMLFIVAIFAGFYIGSDFSNRTIQLELSRGHRRLDILLSRTFVFSAAAAFIMFLYPATVCLIHTAVSGFGEIFGLSSLFYLLRTALLGSILNMGTAVIYACLAFLCRDVPKTICACFAFPVLFSAVSGTVGREIPVIGKALDYATLSQLKYVVADQVGAETIIIVVASSCVTVLASLFIATGFFSRAEIKC